jgi:hypothetical protein
MNVGRALSVTILDGISSGVMPIGLEMGGGGRPRMRMSGGTAGPPNPAARPTADYLSAPVVRCGAKHGRNRLEGDIAA